MNTAHKKMASTKTSKATVKKRASRTDASRLKTRKSRSPKKSKSRPLKQKRLEARIDSKLDELIHQAAETQGKKYSEFVRASLYEAAQRVLADAHLLQLTMSDQAAFVDALINPPAPNEALVSAFKRQPSFLYSD